MRRLRQSAALLALDVPFDDDDLLRAMCARRWPRIAERSDEAYIRILLTRGVGELSYNPAACPDADARHHRQAVRRTAGARRSRRASRSRSSSVRRNHPQALNPMIKSNNLLNNALAMQEAIARGAEEALMLQPGRRAGRVLAVELLPRAAAAPC